MRLSRLFLAGLLGAALLAPVGLQAQYADHDGDHDRDDRARRYYDRRYNDYHSWNSNEDRAYRRYWTYRHRRYRAWQRANRREQEQYWVYRHAHPDEY